MNDNVLETKMNKLRKLDKDYAKAKKNVTILEHGRKILLSKLMKEKMINSNTGKLDSVNAQEREARTDERYQKHIEALGHAVQQEAELYWEKTIVQLNFEAWKTKMISDMKERKNYNA